MSNTMLMQLDSHSTNLTVNQQEDLSTRIRRAKAFLEENPTEKPIIAARIYNIYPSTFYSSLARPSNRQYGGQNKILEEHHKQAIHLFIRSLLSYGIQPTY